MTTALVDDIKEIKEDNPFESMMSRFDRAAQLLNLDSDLYAVMRVPNRELKVYIPTRMDSGRIQVFEGSQSDERFLSEVANRTAPEGFDIIIDDASHIGELTRRTFLHLFDRHLKPGGLYAIEDWCTGYWDDFPDGKAPNLRNLLGSQNPVATSTALAENIKVPVPCHSYGMVGFVKELIDEQGAASITRNYPVAEHRASKFESVHVTPFIVFVSKVAPILTASPNPVPPGDTKGRTTIS